VSSNALKVLVVDDNRSAADALARVLSKHGDSVSAVYDGVSAISMLETNPPDLILTDLKMEPIDGMTVLRAARACRPPVEVIVFTAFGAVEIAVEAMRLGARDFLTKPVTVEQVDLRLRQIKTEIAPTIPVPDSNPPFIAKSPSSILLLERLRKAADVSSPVLLEGEMGSGRGYAALTLHRLCQQAMPFKIWDITRDREWPKSGTVFLPNIDDLPDDLQRKLARDIQHAPTGLRLIGSASPDGRRLIAEGRLRADLYYTLSVIVIPVPPLRQRTEDVIPLVRAGVKRFSSEYRRHEPEILPNQMTNLQRHKWPGNVREVMNLGERAVVMGNNAFNMDIHENTDTGLPNLEPGFCLSSYLEGLEQRILEEALRKAQGDRNLAGKLLNVERNTLRYKLNKYGLLS